MSITKDNLFEALLSLPDNQKNRLSDLIKEVSDDKADVVGPQLDATLDCTPADVATAGSLPRHSRGHPPLFDGERSRYRAWAIEMKSKLRTDKKAIGGVDRTLFEYIFTRLEGTAQKMCTAYVESGGTNHSPAHFMLYLDRQYLDPNAKQRALDRLQNLRQSEKESFATFLPKFEKELADCGGAAWPEEVKVNYLKNVLSKELKVHLLHTKPATNYGQYIIQIQDMQSKLDGLRYSSLAAPRKVMNIQSGPSTRSFQGNSTSLPGSSTVVQPAVDEMDWQYEGQPARPSIFSARTYTVLTPDEKKANGQLKGKRAKWVDPSEMIARKREGRCLRCGRSRCQIKICPLEPPRRPEENQSTRISSAGVIEQAAVEDEVSRDEQ